MNFIIRSAHKSSKYNIRLAHTNAYKQHISSKIKEKLFQHSGFASGSVILQRVGSAPDTSPAVVLQTPHQSYLFNCGEGTERALQSCGISSATVSQVFLTQKHWGTLGGVAMLLEQTSAQYGSPPEFHGPEKLFQCIRRISLLSALGAVFYTTIKPEIVNETGFYEDADVRIDKISVDNDEGKPEYKALLYMCKLKALQGIRTHRNTSFEARSPDRPETNFLILDLPNASFLSSFASNNQLDDILEKIKPNTLDFIVHFTPTYVYQIEEYQEAVKKLQARRDFLLNDSSRYTSVLRLNDTVNRLHEIDSRIHPLISIRPHMNRTVNIKATPTNSFTDPAQQDLNRIILYDASRFSQTSNSKQPEIDIIATQPRRLKDLQYPHIVFLGTSSATPSHSRSNAAILVNLSEKSSILLDCGEGTAAQITRLYGTEAPTIFKRLESVFISHMHTDHYIGLVEVLRMRDIYWPDLRNPTHIIGSTDRLKSWLFFYSNNTTNNLKQIEFIDSLGAEIDGLDAITCEKLGLSSFRTCSVPHSLQSCAASLTFPYEKNGKREVFKLTYSGDTVPCDEIIELGRNSTLLIHEATFMDRRRAANSCHSTVDQAIEQGQKMNAEYTILTHFTKQFGVMPPLRNQLPKNVGIAFDYMHVTYNDLSRMSSLIPKYSEAFRPLTISGKLHPLDKRE